MGFVDVSAVVATVLAFCYYSVKSNDLHFTEINIDALTSSNYLPLHVLAAIRALFSFVVFSTCLYVLLDKEGLHITVTERGGGAKKLHLKHLERFTTFTGTNIDLS
jgi:hypothetical protein